MTERGVRGITRAAKAQTWALLGRPLRANPPPSPVAASAQRIRRHIPGGCSMTLWSTLASTLNPTSPVGSPTNNQTRTPRNSPPPPPTIAPPAAEFEFYDPRGLGAKEPSAADASMESTAAIPSSLPASPTPSTRAALDSASPGVPLNLTRVQRHPSTRARDAFTRLRIGSFGNASRPSDLSSLDASNNSQRTLSPEDIGRSHSRSDRGSADSSLDGMTSAVGERQRESSAPPAIGASPAAAFLSSFSPSSSTSLSKQNTPTSLPGSRDLNFKRNQSRNHPHFAMLPPQGDQEGFVLPLMTAQLGDDEDDAPGSSGNGAQDKGEWILGGELGSGGMGLVREAIWKPLADDQHPVEKRKRRRKVAVKIVKRSFSGGSSSTAGAGAALEAFGFGHREGAPGSGRPLPGTRAASFQFTQPNPRASASSSGLRNPSKDRLLETADGLSGGSLERNRSSSSPTKPPPHLFPPPSSSSATGSLSPIEQSPLPSPGLTSPANTGILDIEPSPEQTLLNALLERELNLWAHVTSPMPPLGTRSGTRCHPNIVPLLATAETDEHSYILMPLCDGGSLLAYLNSPTHTRDEVPQDLALIDARPDHSSRERSSSQSTSRSRDRGLRGRNTLPRTKPRSSLPFASSTSSSPSQSTRTSRFLSPPVAPQERALNLLKAGDAFSQIVEGLKWLHQEKGVVHKDLKLENLLSRWESEDYSSDEESETASEMTQARGRAQEIASASWQKSWKRVWKVADFGLSDIIPKSPQKTTQRAKQQSKKSLPALGVQPLSTLSRGGSLSRPNGAHHAHAHLSHTVGPGAISGQTLPNHLPALVAASTNSASPDLSAHLHPIGSLPYSAPEALRSPIPILDPSVDIWALGCILYAMIEGVLPIWDELEFRLRTRLIKGEWELPENLKSREGDSEEITREKEMVLEVIKGCLNTDVEQRWTIEKVASSPWLDMVKKREARRKADARAERQRKRQILRKLTIPTRTQNVSDDIEMHDAVFDLPPSPARGRSSTRALLPPPFLSSLSSSTTSSTAASASTSTSRSSSSRSLSRSTSHANGRRSPVAADSPTCLSPAISHSPSHPALRRPSRSTSRSSAYAHQGVDSKTQNDERKERGRSQRRLRWDEEKETTRRKRSESRDAFEGAIEGVTARGRSNSRGSVVSKSAGKSRDRGERLETVGEPY
ncbi:uncharacterized protein JCM15063_002366 [Sporobolomyces koalae]|uniref:uncharacterized protein n=1 Tax=Sporobolomyces koalae TaxID=500713 RepID=UPI00316FE0D9